VTAILVALEVGGCGFAAKIAIDALVVAVVGSCDILGILVGYVGHSDGKVKSPHPDCNGFFVYSFGAQPNQNSNLPTLPLTRSFP
jgi:hypothetical protein